MDYDTNILYFENPFEREEALDITIYADKEYINNVIISLENLNHTRISSSDNND